MCAIQSSCEFRLSAPQAESPFPAPYRAKGELCLGCGNWENTQSSGLVYLPVSFLSQRSAAARSSMGMGLRDASVLQFPIVPR
jgi:hypothetical protein